MSAANTPPPSRHYSQPSTADNASYSRGSREPFAGDWSGYPTARSNYRPTAEQLARDEERRRYLRRNVYAPVIVAAVVVLTLFVVIVLLAFGVIPPPAASFIAGLSGLVIILIALPLIGLFSILPIAWLAFVLHRRQQRKEFPERGSMAYRSRVQTLFWQVDSFLGGAQRSVDELGARARKPMVAIYGRVAYLKEFWRGIKKRFTRSI